MDQFDIGFELKSSLERMGIEYVTETYAKSVISLVSSFDDELITHIFVCASREYTGTKKVPEESWWRPFVNAKKLSWDTMHGKFRYEMPKAVSESETDLVKRLAREAAERFGWRERGTTESLIDQKEARYRGYVSLGLVQVDQYFHALHGEWVTRNEAHGLTFRDPAVWLKNRDLINVKRGAGRFKFKDYWRHLESTIKCETF